MNTASNLLYVYHLVSWQMETEREFIGFRKATTETDSGKRKQVQAELLVVDG